MSRPKPDHAYHVNRAKFKAKCKEMRSPCARCHGELGPIDYDCEPQLPRAFELGHIQDAASRPDLYYTPSNWQSEHCSCNRSAQALAKKNKKALQPVVKPLAVTGAWVKPTF
jgi:hypothetical protein